jgi:hypothetical protein
MFQPVLDYVGNWLTATNASDTQGLSPDLFDMWSIDSDDHVRIRTPPTNYDEYDIYAPAFGHITEYNLDELILDDHGLTSPEPEDYQ